MKKSFLLFIILAILSLQCICAWENPHTIKAIVFENESSTHRLARTYVILDNDLFLYRGLCCSKCAANLTLKDIKAWKEGDSLLLSVSPAERYLNQITVKNLVNKTEAILIMDEESLHRLPKIATLDTSDGLKIILTDGSEWQAADKSHYFHGTLWCIGDRMLVSQNESSQPMLINMDQPSAGLKNPVAWALNYNLRELAVNPSSED